jgi:hypothetical protein
MIAQCAPEEGFVLHEKRGTGNARCGSLFSLLLNVGEFTGFRPGLPRAKWQLNVMLDPLTSIQTAAMKIDQDHFPEHSD